MNKTIDLVAVTYFLNVIKKEILRNNFILEPRKDIDIGYKIVNYKEALLDLSITLQDVKEKIINLKSTECIDISFDRDKNRDYNSEIFEFITYINEIKTYIKITMNDEYVICISFHRSKF